jgi:3-oxoacyl-[acyl-carrier protein] reductase
MRLKGKVAIVTGGAQGIGRAYSLRFAKEGAAVAVWDLRADQARDVAREIGEAGGRALAQVVDVTSEEQTQRAAEQVKRELGRIDCLINNAALYHDQNLADQSIPYLRTNLEINLIGVLICSRAVFPHMKAGGGGSIINISSTAAYPLPLPAFPTENFGNYAYALSKAGVIALTQQMARQGGADGIRVNAIAPGVTMSEATKKVVPQWALDGLKQGAALQSVLQPDDLAGTAVHLASEDSRMMTGQVMVVDAGVVMHG